ncbi:gliding motility-associated C-terminal domain-containing protein [Zobellia uliginosa]|uniref:Ig-like domain-containing protein n=1 Tax=Zobellia uliginosa TaxID=143224 RepID=UPI001C064DB7|nr:gliding motility-associated C-terminal domain-containing protein [Zobellia uliginosa]MBU2947429.1 DUF11 domain-containing protein [Zobellia uliginosa]
MRNLAKFIFTYLLLSSLLSFTSNTEFVEKPTITKTETIIKNEPSFDYAPTFSNCPSDITNVMPNSGDCTAVVSWTPPTATGTGPVTISSNYNPGDSFYSGTHRVIYRATDINGTSFCEFTVQVVDNQQPVITVPANITVTADAASCGAIVTFPFPTATDNCPAGEGAPIDENFDSGADLSLECYNFNGTFISNQGKVNGSPGELKTVELIDSGVRSLTSPLTQFNGTGEIFFDHLITAGSSSGNIGNGARLTVKLVTAAGVETIIYTELYLDENVQTEFIPITQSGNYRVKFEWETNQSTLDKVHLDDLYIPGFIVSDTNVVSCGEASHSVAQVAGFPFVSGSEFPVGTTTLSYFTQDANGNFAINSFTVTVNNNIVPPAGDDVEYCAGSPVPELSVTVGTGETADWYNAEVGGGLLLEDSLTYTPSGPGDYYVETRNIATGCVSSTRRRIRLTENPKPNAPSANSLIEYCVNDTATELTATGDSGNLILWYDAATGGTVYPSAPTPDTTAPGTTSYYVEQVDSTTGCVSDRTQVDVTVYSLPTAPTVTTPVNYCIGDSASQLDSHATGTNLKWYDAASGGNEIPGTTTPDTSTAGQQSFWVTQSSSNGSANCEGPRRRLNVNVYSAPTITTQPTNEAVCEGGTVTFDVAASGSSTIQWQLFNGSAWNDLTNTAPHSGVTASTLTVTDVTLAMSGNRYRAVATSPAASCADATSNEAILTVNTAPPVPTSGGDQTECEENPIQTLTATATPPSGASIIWYDALTGGNVVASPTLDTVGTITYYAESNDTVNGCPSVGRTAVTLTIQPAPNAPVSGGDQTECEENPIQTLTATATAPAGTVLVWYDAATGGNVVASPEWSTVGTEIFYAESQDDVTGCPSLTRTAVSLTIQPAPAPPTSGGDQTECETNPIQTLTATATVPSGFTLTWYDAATGGNIVASPDWSSVGSITYYAESENSTTNCISLSRTAVTLTIDAIPVAPTSGGDQTECEANPTQTMTATATAPAGATVVWYTAATGGSMVGSPTLNAVGTVTYYAESRTTSSGCVSETRTAVVLTMNSTPTIAITPSSQMCSVDLTTYSVSVDVNRGMVTSTEGTVTDNGGNNWTISGVPSGNNITVTVSDANTCAETININAPNCSCPTVNAPTSGGDQTECETNPIQTLTATATPPSGASIVWYDAASGGNIVASPTRNTVGTSTFYAESVDDLNGCTSTTRTAVNLTIQQAPAAPVSGGNQTECEANPIQTLTATATSAPGTSIIWYDAATGGNVVASPTRNAIGTSTFYAESQDDGTSCVSHTRTAVVLTIEPNPAAPVSGGNQTECETNPMQTLTATATTTAGSSVVWYTAATGGTVVASPTLNAVGTVTYFAESENTTTSCVSSTRTPVVLTIQDTPDISIATAAACAPDLLTYSVSVDVSEGGVTSSEGTVTDNGGNNWTISGITSGNDITLTVTAPNACTQTLTVTAPNCSCPVVDAPISGGDQTECEENPIQTLTATATPPADATIVWYDAATGGNVVASPTRNTVGTSTFYAESVQNVTNCVSATRTAVVLTINTTPNAPVSGGDQIECEQTPIQTLTATATAPAGSTVVWYTAATGGSIVASPTLNTVGTVTYFAESQNGSSSCPSFTRTPVQLTIQDTPTIAQTPSSAVCSADLTTYNVSVDVSGGTVTSSEGTVTDNGGNNWTISGVTSGNDIIVTSTPANGCVQTLNITAPNCACPTVTAPVSGGDQTECEENPVQTLTATATPPADATVVWYDAATGGSVVASPTRNSVGTSTFYAESVQNVTSCTSDTRTAVTLTIEAAPTAPVSGGDQTECEENPIQTLTATATAPAGSTVVWYDAATGGNIVASPIRNTVGTSIYYAESENSTTSCTSFNRTAVSLTIEAAPGVPTSGGDQTECEASPIQTLTATATAPAGASIVWYDAATGGNIVASPTRNTVGAVTYYAESSNNSTSCASFTRTPVTLTIQDTPDISVATAAACAPDLLTYSVSVDVSEGGITSTEGTVTDNGGNNWTISGITAGNNITLTVTAPNACTQTLAVTAPDCSCPVVDAPVSGGDQTECEANPIQILTATATPPANATVVWYDAPTGGSVVASPTRNTVGTSTYYAESVENVTNCTSSTRTAVSLTIEATPTAPVSGGDQTECDANPTQTLTATATAPTGASVVWYDAATGGNIVTNPILDAVGNTTYYAESSDDASACTSFTRTAVTLTIQALPNVVANATTTTINAGEPVTLTGSGASSYVWDNGVTDGDTVYPLVTTTYTVIGTDGNSCDNTDSVTITVNATSDIRIEKIVDEAAPNVGDTVTFTLTAHNDGPSDDTGGSVINDILPSGYTYTGDTGSASNGTYDAVSGDWTLPALTNGNSVAIDITATVNAPTAAANEYLNIAQVTSATNFDSDSTPNNDDGDQSEDDEASVEVIPQVADLEVTNTISQPSGNPGDTVVLTVTIQNNGPDAATNLSLENIVPVGFTVTTINDGGTQSGNTITWSGLSIPDAGTTVLTYEATVNNPTNVTDEYMNTVQVTSVDQFDNDSAPNNDDGDQSEDDEDAISLRLQSSDLEIVNTVTPDSGNPGDTLTFSVEVINNGTDDATGINLENYVPSGFTVTAINDGGTQSGSTLSWLGLAVPNGTSQTVTFEATINVPTNTTGEYFNTVQVVAVDQLDPNSTPNNDDGDQSEDDEDNAEIVLIPADLSLSKNLSAASNPTPNAGDTVTFEVTVTNEGPGLATNVSVEDILPLGYTLGTINDGGVVTGNIINWTIASLPVGSQILSYEVTLNAPTNAMGEYDNTAQITAMDQFDPDSTPNNDDGDQSEDDEVLHIINAPSVDLEITKMVDKSQTFHEDTIVFRVIVGNNDAYEATNIGIEDVLPSGYILVSHTADYGAYNETTSTWEIPSLPINTEASLEMTVTVTDVDDYTNVAELIYVDQIDLNIDNDRAEVTPEVTQSSCLTVYNEFSPNGDGANDIFFIECIEQYPNSVLSIYNRWGAMVFSSTGYDNSWDGKSLDRAKLGSSDKLPVGTYYYTLELGDGTTSPKSGWLYISR